MKKVWKIVFASALPQIMNIISNLILPSLIIAKFGSEINGLVTSTKTIISYISIVGAGIATATTQALYDPVARKDILRIKGMLHAASDMFNRFGIVYCIIAGIVAFIFPFSLNTTIEYFTIVILMIVMSVSGASEFFAIGRCRSLLYANQKTYVCTIIQAISIAGSLLLALVMLKLNANIVLVQFSISFVYVIRAFFLTGYVKKNYPELSDYKKVPPIKAAVEKRKDAMIHQLSGLAVTGSQTMILTVVVGLQAASIYSVYNIVFSGLQSICANLSTAVTPFIGRELALKNKSRMLMMYDYIEFAFFNLVSFIYSVAMLMIVPFVSIYTKHADISYIYLSFATIFVYASAFYILKMPSNSLINISGQFKETRWRAIFEGILTVGGGILLTMLVGLNGVVIVTAIALSWRCIDTIIYTNRNVLHCGNFKSIFRLIRVVILLSVMAIVQIRFSINVSNYFSWAKWACFTSVIVLGILLVNAIIFDMSTFKGVVRLIANKKNKKYN